MFRDVQNGEYYNVFGNKALKNSSLLQHFIAVLERESYDNLYKLLLSESDDSNGWNSKPKNVSVQNMKNLPLKRNANLCLMDETSICSWNSCRRCVRGIAWVMLFGHHPILQYLISLMIEINGNAGDLFLNYFNKRSQPHSNICQDATEKLGALNHSMIGETLKKPNSIREDNSTDSTSDSYRRFACADNVNVDRNRNISVDTDNEPVRREQCRLLCLGCYSDDLKTVQILLQHVNTDTLNYKFCNSKFCKDKNPLIIACKYGFLDIAMELLKAGADVNINDGCHKPLTVACENGQTGIVRALLKAGADVNEGNGVCTP